MKKGDRPIRVCPLCDLAVGSADDDLLVGLLAAADDNAVSEISGGVLGTNVGHFRVTEGHAALLDRTSSVSLFSLSESPKQRT